MDEIFGLLRMDVFAAAPFTAGSIAWQSLPGQWTLTIVCKATYELRPGVSPVASEREGLSDRDNHWDDDPERSIYAPGDLSPLKPRPEVVLVGSAYAPRAEPTRTLIVRMRIGIVDKAIEVFVPRTVMGDGAIREGAPWKQMPLLYERAAGGPHSWNPLGVGAHTVDRHGRRSLPNLHRPSASAAEAAEPICFGPIASTWTVRRERLGIRETSWSDEGWSKNPLGAGFDAAYFQTAPADQWLDALHADEALTLENLHPDHSLLTTRLPGVRPRAKVETNDGSKALELVADTLWIDTNRAICTLTWRGQLRVDGPETTGRVLVGTEEKGQLVRWPAAPPKAHEQPSSETVDADALHYTADEEAARSALASHRAPSEVLPFRSLQPPARVSTLLGAASTSDAAIAAPIGSPFGSSASPSRAPSKDDVVSLGGIDERALGRAAYGGVLQASNAAAGGVQPRTNGPIEGAPRSSDSAARALYELLWFAPASVAAIRAMADGAPIAVAKGDAEETPDAARDRASVLAALTRATPLHDVEASLYAAVEDDGRFEPRLGVVAGEIETVFDEVETLKILAGAAGPLAPGDKKLKEVLDLASEVMKTPLGGSSEVAASFVVRVREAWSKANRMLPADYLDHHARRLLLEQRLYQKRQLSDVEWIRALLTPPGASAPMPAYLPLPMGRWLPLFTRFQARVIATIVPQQDQSEASPVALRVCALARVVPARPRTSR